MPAPKVLIAASGLWAGTSKLQLSHLPPDQRVTESPSTLTVAIDPHTSYALVNYVWEYDGEKQYGTVLVCGDESGASVDMAWSDSWHQNSAVMNLKGSESGGSVKASGTWGPEEEPWGWTVGFGLEGESLVMRMEVVTPTGDSDWAVEAVYSRV